MPLRAIIPSLYEGFRAYKYNNNPIYKVSLARALVAPHNYTAPIKTSYKPNRLTLKKTALYKHDPLHQKILTEWVSMARW